MARPTLYTHRKFKRLSVLLGMPEPHILGHLEYLWRRAYESGDPVIGDALDVEIAAGGAGERGKFTSALVECGAPVGSGFVEVDDRGVYSIHDLWDHAPDYVKRRFDREESRLRRGVTRSDIARAASNTRWKKSNDPSSTDANDMHLTDQTHTERMSSASERMQTNATPAPTPAPTPTPLATPPPPFTGGGATGAPVVELESARETRRRPPLPYDDVAALWNSTCTKLPAVSKLTQTRRAHLSARFQDAADFAKVEGDLEPLDVFRAVFQAIHEEPFNLGDNDRGWRADFDYAIRANVFAKTWEKARDRPRLDAQAAKDLDDGIIIGRRYLGDAIESEATA